MNKLIINIIEMHKSLSDPDYKDYLVNKFNNSNILKDLLLTLGYTENENGIFRKSASHDTAYISRNCIVLGEIYHTAFDILSKFFFDHNETLALACLLFLEEDETLQ